MQPRAVIIAGIQSHIAREAIAVLQNIGVFTFYAEKDLSAGELWSSRLEDELNRAHVVIVVFDPSTERFHEESHFREEIDLVLRHLSNDPKLVIIPVAAPYLTERMPTRMRAFRVIYFIEALSPENRRSLVDRVLEAWHSAERGTVPPLDELIAEAQVMVPRLNVLIAQSRTTELVTLSVTAVTGIAGLSLSIPSVLSRWSLSDYWLLIGPILFVFGGLATTYLFLRERRERKRIWMAAFVQLQLKELINRIEKFRKRSNSLELAKSE